MKKNILFEKSENPANAFNATCGKGGGPIVCNGIFATDAV